MGSHLGVDLTATRVHDDPHSRDATGAMAARAFAYGDDVFLGPCESASDTELLAHELTHVAQQRGGAPAPQRKIEVGASDHPAEHEADQVAAQVAGGQAAPAQLLVDGGVVAPGQMEKQAFLARLREQVTAAADQELGKLGSAVGCPYIEQYFARYAGEPATRGEALLHRWVPATRSARTAAELIPLVLERVRAGIRTWRDTGKPPADLIDADSRLADVAPPTPGGPARAKAAPSPGSLDALEMELGPGQPLAAGAAARMSRAIGTDVSGARIHTGPVAAAKAAAHGAAAFAVGGNVVMGSGAPAAGTLAGDALLAHELAHTAQQREAAADPVARRAPIGDEDHAAEVDAGNQRQGLFGGMASRVGDFMRTGLQLQRCATDGGTQSVDGYTNFKNHEQDIAYDAGTHLKTLPFATHDPAVTWTSGGQQLLTGKIADQLVNGAFSLESLVRPDSIQQLVDHSRVMDRDPHMGGMDGKGPDAYFQAVGIEVGNALARRIDESLKRELPRYAQARIADGREPAFASIPISHPVDPLVTSALTLGGVVDIDITAFQKEHPDLTGPPRQVLQSRKIDLTPVGTSGMWYRLNSPLDATPEEIATQLAGGPTETFRLEIAHPLYGLAADTRGGGYVDPSQSNPAGVLLRQDSGLADEAALAQASTFGTAAKPRPSADVIAQIRLNATLLKTSVKDAAKRFGLGGTLDAVAQRIDNRAAALTGKTDAEVGKWDTQAQAQAAVIAQGAQGLETCNLRLHTYATQFGDDLTKDPGAFGLPDEHRQALRTDAELWVAALEVCDLVGSADKKLQAAGQHSATVDIEIMEQSLASPQVAVYNANASPSDTVNQDFDPATMGVRENEMRAKLGQMRAQVLADPSKLDKGADKTSADTRQLVFESQVVIQAESVDQAWRALDDTQGFWSTMVDNFELQQLKDEAKGYYGEWKAVYKLIKDGKKEDARVRFEALCAKEAFISFLHRVDKELRKVQKHQLIAKVIAMVVITVASMGVGAVVEGLVGGAEVAVGAAGAADAATVATTGLGMGRTAGAIAGFIAETGTFTLASNLALSKDHRISTILTEFGKNIVLFGAMRAVSAAFKAAGLAKVIEAGAKEGAPLSVALKGEAVQLAQAVTMGGVGVLAGIIEARIKEAVGGKKQTEEELKETVFMAVAQTLIMVVVGRLMESPLKQLKFRAAMEGTKVRLAFQESEHLLGFAQALEGKVVSNDQLIDVVHKDRLQIQREIDAFEELKARADKDPKLLDGTGLTKASLDAHLGTLKGAADTASTVEMTLGLEQKTPNHFLAPRARTAELLAAHAKLGSTPEIVQTDADGARTWRITPKAGSDQVPLYVTEQMPAWAQTPGGARVRLAAAGAGIEDAFFALPDAKVKQVLAADQAMARDDAAGAKKAWDRADLDPALRAKLEAQLSTAHAQAKARTAAFVEQVRSGLSAEETPTLDEMIKGKTPDQIDQALGTDPAGAQARVKARVARDRDEATRLSASSTKAAELKALLVKERAFETYPEIKALVEKATPGNMRETIRRIRSALGVHAVSSRVAAQHPNATIYHEVQVWAEQPEASLAEWQANHPKGRGAKMADGKVWLQVSDIDVLALEPGPVGGKQVVVHMGEVKTGANDSPTEARGQLDKNLGAMAGAASGGPAIRMEVGGKNIAGDVDLSTAVPGKSATYGPSRPPAGPGDETFDHDLGITSEDLSTLSTELLELGKKSEPPKPPDEGSSP